MENLIENYKNLVYSISHYFDKYQNKEDLFQAGCIGLIEAYKRYNPEFGAKFSTYAYPYILGEMKRYIREDKGIKVSRDIAKLSFKIEKANILLSQKLMRKPTVSELSLYLEIPEELINEALNTSFMIQSLDEKIDDNLSLYETVAQSDRVDINDLIELKSQLKQLNKEENELIKMRYLSDLTQSEVAKKLGMSQVQVSRYEKKVLQKLKTKMT